MSSTDCSQFYRGSCICGNGEIIIDFCTPDHPWPTKSKWFETSITCKSCQEKYRLVEQDKKYILVDRLEVLRRDEYQREYEARKKALMSSMKVEKLLRSFFDLLEQQSSIAAIYRLLYSDHLVFESLNTFRKKWKDTETWIQAHITSANLAKVIDLVGVTGDTVLQEINEVERIGTKCKEPLPCLGEPLCDISCYP